MANQRLAGLLCLCCLAGPAWATAQTVTAPPTTPAPQSYETFWRPFKAAPQDVVNFFSADTARILGIASAGLMVAHRWDDDGIAVALGRFKPVTAFRPGNIWGGLYSQVGGAFAVYALGKATKNETITAVGGDLFRAQLLTQGVVQTMKVSFHRWRPDGSNHFSLPSGHTASAVATATVLERHFGWKVGIPAYAVSAYVGASRMSANKHHLTDVMLGAAVGLSAGRTATIGVKRHRFSVSLTPTAGGAAVMFSPFMQKKERN